MKKILFNETVISFSTLVFPNNNLNIYEIKIPESLSKTKNNPKIGEGVAIVAKNNFAFGNQLFTITGFTNHGSVEISPFLFLILRNNGIIDDDFITIAYGLKNDILKIFTPETSIYPFPNRYNVLDLLALEKGINLKRAGKYYEAHTIYLDILKKEQGSSMLYSAMAKNLACMKRYDEAISLFKLANQAVKILTGEDDYNYQKHIFNLSNRNNMSKKDFLLYMKSISGNPNYIFSTKK